VPSSTTTSPSTTTVPVTVPATGTTVPVTVPTVVADQVAAASGTPARAAGAAFALCALAALLL
jgi:hypothetical protein